MQNKYLHIITRAIHHLSPVCTNHWESYVNRALGYSFNLNGDCGPVAITNIIKMYGNKYNNSAIKNKTDRYVFNKVMEVNDENDEYYFSYIIGTYSGRAGGFIKDSFKKFNVNVDIYGQYAVNYTNTLNALGSTNRLMYINLRARSTHPYGDHAVVGYAYTRLINNDDSKLRAFIKICDGKSADNRFIEIDSVIGSEYYEVYFK